MREPVGGADVCRAGSLGGCVVLVDDRTPPLDHLALGLDRARRGRVQHDLLRRQVVFGAYFVGQLEHAHEHRRHPLRVRHAVLLDAGECAFGIEVLHHDHGPAEAHRAHRIEERRRVIQRRRGKVDGVAVHPPNRRHHPHLDGLIADPLPRDLVLHALRPPRRPRGIQHPGALELFVERHRRIPIPRRLVRLVSGHEPLEIADHQPDLHARHLVEQLGRDIAQRVTDDEHLRVTVVENVSNLVRIEMRVDTSEEQPRPLRRPTRLEELRPVLHQNRDVIPKPQPRSKEELRKPVRPIIELPICNAFTRSRHHISKMRRPFSRVFPRPHENQKERLRATCARR